jgi:homocysteine S-methyltransferase
LTEMKSPETPPLLVAASIGPYGAMLNGGQEYTGEYGGATLEDLVNFHRPRARALLHALPDLLAYETIPSLLEAQAIVQLQTELNGPLAWVSFQCRDTAHIADGSTIEAAIACLRNAPGVCAVGVNCCAPDLVEALVQRLAVAAPGLSIVVYPNNGRVWDGERMEWLLSGPDSFPAQAVQRWMRAGANIIGGCCGISASGVAAIASVLHAEKEKKENG